MKIIELKSENIKRIKAIEIIPKDNMVIISGKNGAGKSSVLDSIWFALEGKASLRDTPIPIRKGEKRAEVRLVVGDFIVTRHWTDNDKSYLKVTNKEGLPYNSPQELLDSFIGKLTFDPLEFAGMKEKEQSELLLEVAGVNLDEIDEQISVAREGRRLQGQRVKLLEGQREVITPEIVPEKLVNTSELNRELEKTMECNQIIAYAELDREGSKTVISGLKEEIEDLENKINNVKTEIERHKNIIKSKDIYLKQNKTIEIGPIRNKIEGAEEANEIFRANERNKLADQKLSETQKIYDIYTKDIQALLADKESTLKSAKMPISGLGISDTSVTYNDIPFSQLSLSEQLRVSLAIAMALNPKLKVIRITDGSLLDDNSMEVIKRLADKRDYQIWLEKVDSSGKIGFYIEEGEVKNEN